MSADFEIIGLLSGINRRSCIFHEVCGFDLQVGGVVRLVPCSVSIERFVKEAIKCVKAVERCDQCTVALSPVPLQLYLQFKNTYTSLSQLLNSIKRNKFYKNMGVVLVAFLYKNKRQAK